MCTSEEILQQFDPTTASDGYIIRREKRLSTSEYRHTRTAVFIDHFAVALLIRRRLSAEKVKKT